MLLSTDNQTMGYIFWKQMQKFGLILWKAQNADKKMVTKTILIKLSTLPYTENSHNLLNVRKLPHRRARPLKMSTQLFH